MNELALAVYASETGTHMLRPPLDRRWTAHLRSFDTQEYEQRLGERGFRFIPRAQLPPLLRAIHDPPLGLFVRGRSNVLPGGLVADARACVARLRSQTAAQARGYGQWNRRSRSPRRR